MEVTLKIDSNELDENVLQGIKKLFAGKEIVIIIKEVGEEKKADFDND
ncbi:MAG: hypothetical protein M3040_02340 [Bacteroidota bacterium]|nr:hypothetical protein [Bacteroidota bacterium]